MADVIVGKSGKNKLTALENKTQVYGLAGNDTLSSNGKSDVLLVGGSGNDVLNMTGGSGTLSGGKGKDTFNLAYSSKQKISAVIEDIDPTKDKIIITNSSSGTAQINSVISGGDVILTDDKGYFSVTLKGSNEASDYYEGTAHEYIWDILRIVNQERENRNLSPLTLSQGLMDAASIRANEIIENYSHTRPDGSSCFTAIKKDYWSTGENIYSSPTSPEAAMEGWMNSTGHRANILNSGYEKIGIGYTYDGDSQWKYHWVQMFGGNLSSPDTISPDKILTTSISLKGAKILTDTAKNADPITNTNPKVTITGSADNDSITSKADNVKINGGDGNDTINVAQASDYDWDAETWVYTTYNKAAISGGKGADIITNYNNQAVIDGGAGFDKIFNHGDKSTVQAASGNNLVVNGEYFGKGGTNINVSVGSGNDTITNSGSNSMLNGGAGDDVIYNGYYYYEPWNAFYETGGGSEYNDALGSSNVTIIGGTGNDFIKNNGEKILFKYTKGDGNDFIRGFGKTDTLSIAGSTYSTLKDFKDIIVKVGEGKITLEGAANLDNLNIMSDFLAVDNSTKSPVKIVSTIKTVDASKRTKAVKITGNALANSIVGGSGNDSLLGGKGNDTLKGGTGNDTLTGGADNDIFIYTAGKDVITDYSADDKISLGAAISKTTISGSDVVFTLGKGSLTIKKGKGKTLNIIDSAGKKYSTVVGGTTLTLTNAATSPVTADASIKVIDASKRTKAVQITGNKLANTISGGSKADTIYGGKGNDSILGNAGNDIIYGDKGNDSLWGGDGNDIFIYEAGKDVISDYTAGQDKIQIAGGKISKTSLSGSDVLFTIGKGSLTVKNAKGKTISLLDSTGKASSTVVGAQVFTNSNKASVTIGADMGFVDSSARTKAIKITGNALANTICGGSKNDSLFGAAGNDSILGNNGSDKLYGDAGNDILLGGKGNDSLWGGAGNDSLWGDAGADKFIYVQGDGKDIIFGFDDKDTLTLDKLDFTASHKNGVVTFKVDGGSITLKDFTATTFHVNNDIYHISGKKLVK